MASSTVFYQSCPICGRTLRIPAKYFGRQMSCTHCEGEFRAGNEELQPPPRSESAFSDPLMASLPTVEQALNVQQALGEV